MARRYEFHKRRRNVQNIETQFGSLPYPKITFLDDAGVDGRLFRQVRHLARLACWRASRFVR
jgi:hypothetical protein